MDGVPPDGRIDTASGTRLARLIGIAAAQAVAVVVLLEVALRFYNPLPFRVRGSRIVLPVHKRYVFHNEGAAKLEPVTTHTKNSLGFRGPDPPADFSRRLTVVTIGGSTTECLFLSDGKTWTDVLARRLAQAHPDVWVNNAGLDGQSTYGHLVLLRDFIVGLRPKVAVFLVGVNDIGLEDTNQFDNSLSASWVPWRERWNVYESIFTEHRTPWHSEWVFLTGHSEIAGMVENFRRMKRAKEMGFSHQEIDLRTRETYEPEAAVAEQAVERIRGGLAGYASRLDAIIELCRRNGIEPVLVTQPILAGDAIDPATGVNLATIMVNSGVNGSIDWRRQELYNDVARRVAGEKNVLLVEAARQMPKDSRLFYDFIHFTNEGAARVGAIVADALEPFVRDR